MLKLEPSEPMTRNFQSGHFVSLGDLDTLTTTLKEPSCICEVKEEGSSGLLGWLSSVLIIGGDAAEDTLVSGHIWSEVHQCWEDAKRKKASRMSRRYTKRNKPEEDGAATDNSYQIQEILGSRLTDDGKEEYHIRWKGFSLDECTWEPKEIIDASLLAKYKRIEATKKRRKIATAKSPATKGRRKANFKVQEAVSIDDDSEADTAPTAPTSPPCDSTPASETALVPVIPEFTPPCVKDPSEPRGSMIVTDFAYPLQEQSVGWRVLHLGHAPIKGTPGHWALLQRDSDGAQQYLHVDVVRKYFPDSLFEYLLPRIRFEAPGKDGPPPESPVA
eukprot:Blabericola_migrator_1__5822@NODE_294_length_10256_cov_112_945628_g241_i0_p5_GENE_NODE_294_length_10256_cov_112_945628_g241_i0NODE_294_length_10256_cov_112_945628_g241_i0_p5_ORF_typecomplete_len331_score58_68Chromo/PF00385_24/1_4e03Chromo/PF00385_24/1_8e12Mtf2_C/PF14061_6/0_051Mtf2_C/PF14061_6/1e04_NODE_294_length_10256_cov_112_945628_g241_i032884280